VLAAAGLETPLDLVLGLPRAVTFLDKARTVDELLADSDATGLVAVRGTVLRVTSSFFGKRKTTRVSLVGEGARTLVLHYPFYAQVAAKLVVGTSLVAVGPIARDGKGRPFVLAPRIPEPPFERPLVDYPGALAPARAAIGELLGVPGFPSLVPACIAEACDVTPNALLRAHQGTDALALGEARHAQRIAEYAARLFLRSTEPVPFAMALPETTEVGSFVTKSLLTPTAEQRRAMADVALDLARETPMRRLVLGDVGTGKTLVALAAVVQCVAAGQVAVVFAPTTALADQWRTSLSRLTKSTGAPIVVRVVSGEPRAQPELSSWDVAVGTHALASRGLAECRPALVVVDEPQRTGTRLREALIALGKRSELGRLQVPHLLLLTATPLPRTLALSDDGVLATSVLTHAGRPSAHASEVETFVFPESVLDARLADTLGPALARGERAFAIVPRVRDAATGPGIASLRDRLARVLPKARIETVHAGLPLEAQRAALEAFRSGAKNLLVATTLVEVGLDVPEATTMIVLGAERFGVAQLHQLRGRVGRGAVRGSVLFFHGAKATQAARKRLASLVEEASGAAVARTDLDARGPGTRLGVEQSGASEAPTRVSADSVARGVERLLVEDPGLERPDAVGFARIVARVRRGLSFEGAG
jgi:RecG-like helicase